MPRSSKYSHGLEGKQFSRWTVVSFSHSRRESEKGFAFYWFCRCVCGNEKAVNARLLQRGKSTSCGCYAKETNGLQCLVHGHGRNGYQTVEYRTWSHVIQRCTNPRWNDSWHRYGGRGITVCKGMRDFTVFLKLMGLKPGDKDSIDRMNNNGHYSCGACDECLANNWPFNCRWATHKEQMANTCRSPKYN